MSIPVSPLAAELAAVPTLPTVATAGVAEVGPDIASVGADGDFYAQLPEIAEFRDYQQRQLVLETLPLRISAA